MNFTVKIVLRRTRDVGKVSFFSSEVVRKEHFIISYPLEQLRNLYMYIHLAFIYYSVISVHVTFNQLDALKSVL